VSLLLQLIGFTVQLNASVIAFYTAVAALFLLGLILLPAAASELREALYPKASDARSSFYPLVAQGLARAFFRVSLVIVPTTLTLALAVIDIDAEWPYALLQITLIYGISPTWVAATRRDPVPESRWKLDAIAKLFQAAGYYVTLEPTSKTTELGPLLSGIDLIAEKVGGSGAETSDYAFIITIMHAKKPSAKPLESAQVSNLQTCAWVLGQYKEYKQRLGIRSDTLLPLAIFIGIRPDPVVRELADEKGILLLEIEEHILDRAHDPVKLQEIAHGLLDPVDERARSTSLRVLHQYASQ